MRGAHALLLVRVGAGRDHREMLGGLRVRWGGSHTAVLDAGVQPAMRSACLGVLGWGWSQGAWLCLLHPGVPGMERVCDVEVRA